MDYSEAEAERAKAPPFDHPNNIAVGSARVIWARACHPVGRDPQPEGWVLPGGSRTGSREEAANMAMDALMARNWA